MSKNIHEAINAVMQEVGYVKKTKSAGLNYTFAGESALIAALRPTMVEQGIVMYVGKIYDVTTRLYQSKSGTEMTNTTLTAEIVFTHAESGTSITVQSRGEGADTGDKSNNKAMTCAYKYAMRQTFIIETGDDPDKDASGASHNQPTRQQPAAQSNTGPEPMTLQQAMDTLSSDGKRYGDRPTAELAQVANNPKTPANKKQAAQLILKARAEKGQ